MMNNKERIRKWRKLHKRTKLALTHEIAGLMLDMLEQQQGEIKELEQQLAAKPRYTKEQIEAVKDFDAWISRRHNLSGEFNWWLKEVGND